MLSLLKGVVFSLLFVCVLPNIAFSSEPIYSDNPQHTQTRKHQRSACEGCQSKCSSFEEKDSSQTASSSSDDDEFFDFDDSIDDSDEDAFLDFDENEAGSDDEFEEFEEFNETDEFENFDESAVAGTLMKRGGGNGKISPQYLWVIGILAFTVLSGFLVRNAKTRKLRIFFLLASIVILGFYRGGCPCPIMGFQNLILAIKGVEVGWHSVVWFLALIPITYFFGKVWCGWICHLGALQEFLFMGKFEILKSPKAQDILRYVRISVVVILVVQILITNTNIFVHYDPFKIAFNLFSTSTLGYILLGIMLVSSLFINRPFCRTVCPIGLILGWVSLIPGASVIGVKKGACAGCKSCASACNIHAISRENKTSRLVNQDCIGCGECVDACGQNGLGFHKAGKQFPNIVTLENEKKK